MCVANWRAGMFACNLFKSEKFFHYIFPHTLCSGWQRRTWHGLGQQAPPGHCARHFRRSPMRLFSTGCTTAKIDAKCTHFRTFLCHFQYLFHCIPARTTRYNSISYYCESRYIIRSIFYAHTNSWCCLVCVRRSTSQHRPSWAECKTWLSPREWR